MLQRVSLRIIAARGYVPAVGERASEDLLLHLQELCGGAQHIAVGYLDSGLAGVGVLAVVHERDVAQVQDGGDETHDRLLLLISDSEDLHSIGHDLPAL
jgi:hypothetical protein